MTKTALIGLFAILAMSTQPLVGQWDGPPPWEAAGLDDRQAAAFLLERWTYGPRPGEVERLLETGLRDWTESQLAGDLPGAVAQSALSRLRSPSMSVDQIVRRYAGTHRIAEEAIAAGLITRQDYSGQNGEARQRSARQELERFVRSRDFRPPTELFRELEAQKLYRAVYSRRRPTTWPTSSRCVSSPMTRLRNSSSTWPRPTSTARVTCAR